MHRPLVTNADRLHALPGHQVYLLLLLLGRPGPDPRQLLRGHVYLLGRGHDVLHPVDHAGAEVLLLLLRLLLLLGRFVPGVQQEHLLYVVQGEVLPHQPPALVVHVQHEPGQPGGLVVGAVERVLVQVAAPHGVGRVRRHHGHGRLHAVTKIRWLVNSKLRTVDEKAFRGWLNTYLHQRSKREVHSGVDSFLFMLPYLYLLLVVLLLP